MPCHAYARVNYSLILHRLPFPRPPLSSLLQPALFSLPLDKLFLFRGRLFFLLLRSSQSCGNFLGIPESPICLVPSRQGRMSGFFSFHSKGQSLQVNLGFSASVGCAGMGPSGKCWSRYLERWGFGQVLVLAPLPLGCSPGAKALHEVNERAQLVRFLGFADLVWFCIGVRHVRSLGQALSCSD